MPAALPLLAGAFLAAGTVAATIGTVAAITIAGLSLATVLTVTGVALMAVSALTMKTPKPASSAGQLDSKLDLKAPVPVAYGRSATGGYITYQDSYGDKNKFLALVAVLSAGPIAGIEAHYANDARVYYAGDPTYSLSTSTGVGDGSKLYRNKLRQRYQLGEAPATQTISQAAGLPLPGNPGKASALAHSILVHEYDQDAFPQGTPKNLWVLRGVGLYDPRKDSTYPGGSGAHRRNNPATWEYSENPYLAALDWTLGRWWNGKKQYGIGSRYEEVDVGAFVACANIADANGWKVGGVVVTSDDKFAVLASLLQAGGGLPVARGAQISCSINAPKTSVFTIDSSDLIGEVEIMNSTSWRDRANTVVPSYREESQLWEIIAGEEVASSVYVAEDGGEKKTVEVEYPLVQQAAQAHQLASYELCNSREFLTFNLTCRIRTLSVRVGDAITVNIPEVAAISKKCVVAAREFNPSDLTVTLSLKSETDAKHAFALGQTQVAPPAPALNGYNPSAPGAPASTAWTVAGTELTKDGSKIPAIVIAGENNDPNTASIIVDYRPTGSSEWRNWGSFPRDTKVIELTAVTAQTGYEVAIRYLTVRGVLSDALLLNATAGALKVDWAQVVTGSGKPADNADVTANNTSRDTAAVNGVASSTVTQKLAALDGGGFTDNTAPAVPTGLTVTSTITDAGATYNASWNAVSASDLAGYVIAIKEGAGNYVEFTTTSTSYSRTALTRNTSYTSKVAAYDRAGNRSGFSAEVVHTTARDTVFPGSVTNVTMETTYNSAFIRWTNPNDSDLAFVRIVLKKAQDNSVVKDVSVASAFGTNGSVTITGLVSGTNYFATLYTVDTSRNDNTDRGVGVNTPNTMTAGGVAALDFAPGLSPIQIVSTLPADGNSGPQVVLFQGKLYRWVYANQRWQANVDGSDINVGSLPSAALDPWASLPSSLRVSGVGGANTLVDAYKRADWTSVNDNGGKPADNAGRVIDSRYTDELPAFYYDLRALKGQGESNEFKNAGFGGSASIGYGHLYTVAQWQDPSGGPVKQTLTDSSGAIFERASASTTTWGPWGKNYNAASKPKLGSDLLTSTGALMTDVTTLNVNQLWKDVAGENRPADNAGTSVTFYDYQGLYTVIGNSFKKKVGAGWNVNLWTRESFRGGAIVSGEFDGPDTFIGLSYDGQNLDTFSQLEYSIYRRGDDNVRIYEAGVAKDIFSGTDGIFSVAYDGVTVRYSRNGAVFYTSMIPPGADCTMFAGFNAHAVGSGVKNIQFSAFADNAWATVGGPGKPDNNATSGDNLLVNASLTNSASNWTLYGALTRMVAAAGDPGNYFRATAHDATPVSSTYDIPVAVNKLFFSYWKRSSTAGQQVAFDITFVKADGSYASSGRVNSFVGSSNTWTFFKGSFDVPANAAKFYINAVLTLSGSNQTHDIGLIRIGVTESSATVGAPIGTKVGETDASIVEGRANDPATRINEHTVTVNGGKITAGSIEALQIKARAIGAGQIAAGAITANEMAVNSVSANRLVAASRPVAVNGLNLRIDNDGVMRWGAGTVVTVNDIGATQTYSVSASGTAQARGWLLYVPGRTYLDFTTDASFVADSSHIKIAYRDGAIINQIAGVSTLISGEGIVAASIKAAQLAANSVTTDQLVAGAVQTAQLAAGAVVATKIAAGAVVTEHITVGSLNGDRIQADTLDANKIKAGTVLAGSVQVSGAGALSAIAGQAADPAARINANTTNIEPGKITIQGSTTLDSWRDQTSIKGGAIKANSVSAEKIAINARGITALGLDFRYEAGRLWWSDGHVLYTDDNGWAASPHVPAGSVAWGGGSYNYILWDKGATSFRHVVDDWGPGQTANANTVIMVAWRGGSNFVANYGGTIVNGDRIVTNSIDASRLNVLSLSAITGNVGELTAGVIRNADNSTNLNLNNGDFTFNINNFKLHAPGQVIAPPFEFSNGSLKMKNVAIDGGSLTNVSITASKIAGSAVQQTVFATTSQTITIPYG